MSCHSRSEPATARRFDFRRRIVSFRMPPQIPPAASRLLSVSGIQVGGIHFA